MFGLSPQELLIIALIVVLLFGAKKLPELFSSLGKGIKEFKKAMHEEEPEERKETQESKTS
ncbi:MAG: twin-arginine translocase TatA/TatE family subunit [Armatimonadetes bacterium]|nr:twin-arginine translocase TatA/TatE family subunit [Armatimonadota bacterium]MCX7968779.1 twin-arginine translocase TatA/TatE family subunit [Armatimonadota bacterium]MDW8144087.1 twin-arginine translocase TatA/TatE family subunit [Armatimonadota bacterium]